VLEANPQLEVISNVAVGVDNIDVPVAKRLGITVTNTPNVLTETTADLALALMPAVARRLPEADSLVRSGSLTSWALAPALMGVDLHRKTLGLFGMGRIGRAVARRAVHGFGIGCCTHHGARCRTTTNGTSGRPGWSSTICSAPPSYIWAAPPSTPVGAWPTSPLGTHGAVLDGLPPAHPVAGLSRHRGGHGVIPTEEDLSTVVPPLSTICRYAAVDEEVPRES
jgi:hypothetical protein